MTIRDISVAFGFDVDRASQQQAENSIKGIKNMATKLLGKIAVVFSVAKLTSFAKDCVEAASNVEEMENKFNVVFGDMADEVDKWAEQFADSVGRNKNTIKTYLADQQNLLVGFGMTREEGSKLSEQMTSLALDIASFSNQDEDVAVNAMTKAVMGESEAAKTLGAVLNDTTRAETMAALGMSGTYDSLSQLEKMQVNYNAILRQSPDAVGDCVRSMGSYESSTRQLKAAQEEFKEFIGGQLLPVMSVFVQWVTKGVKAATKFAKAILLDADGNNRILRSFDRIHAVVKRLQPAMERFTSSMKNGINKATDTIKNIINRFGGMENAMKLLAIIAGAFIIAMNWSKIIGGAKAFLSLIQGIGKLFSFANLKILGIVAIIVILALIVEDFINFLMGNDSLIGTIFDKAGIGADNARQAIFNAFNKVKEFLTRTWEEIKAAFEKHGSSIGKSAKKIFGGILTVARAIFNTLLSIAEKAFAGLGGIFRNIDLSSPINAIVSTIDVLLGVLGTLGEFITEHSGIVEVLVRAYAAFKIGSVALQLAKLTKAFTLATAAKIKDAAETVYLKALYAKDFVVSLASSTAALIKLAAQFAINTAAKVADTVAQGAMTAATVAWNVAAAVATTVTTALGAAMAFLTSPIGLVVLAIAALIAIGVLLYKNWDSIKAFALSLWKNVTAVFQAGIERIKSFLSGVVEFIQSNWQALLLLIVNPFAGAFKLLYDNCEGFRNFIKQFLENIKKVWKSVWGAINSFFKGIWNNIASFISDSFVNILSGVTGFVGDIKNTIVNGLTAAIDWIKGLPGQALKWGSDIIDGIVNGIKGAIGKVTDAVKGVADKIKSFLHFSVPDEGPLTDYQSWMPDFMGGLADGISASEDTVLDKVKGVASGIKTLMQGATASAATAASSQVNNTTSNMTQNVNINNSYSGGSTETQKNVSKAMNKSAVDATTQMARGLAYARG